MNYVTKQSRSDMRRTLVHLLSLTLIYSCRGIQAEDSETYLSRFIADLWLEGADILKIIWRDCSKKLLDVKGIIDRKEHFPKFIGCMKIKTLQALDRSLSSDVVPISDGINLVRFELVDGSGNALPINSSSTWTEKELDEGEWKILALRRIAKVLRTHVIKFDFEDTKIVDTVESRGRRRHHMMTMMMFGIVSIGMVLIPMGFQFLAVLGGKALLLAKMALILASIQGLKKIAPTPLNYGIYHPYPYDHFEKRSIHNLKSPDISPQTTLPSMTIYRPGPNSDMIKTKLNRVQVKTNEENLKESVNSNSEISEESRKNSEARIFPVYPGPSTSELTVIDAPISFADLATRPGEVQADYTLDLPYNRFRFQSPTTIVSS
ncbi:unnamed protein product [Parnassius mnemosyne]|uniref:Uncharacterized protein n=1 Tax=Parnassius mnemosyne TaxID=213953 RepID=A0AAV1LYY9_9NEOP